MEARHIVSALLARGFTQIEIAAHADIQQGTVSKLVRGRVHDLQSRTYRKLRDLYDSNRQPIDPTRVQHRGRQPNAEFRRFYEFGGMGGIYVVEVGVYVKVGKAGCIRERLKMLHREHSLNSRAIGRVAAFGGKGFGIQRESECIADLSAFAKPLPHCREYFDGISFEHACDVVGVTLGVAPAKVI